MGDLEEMNKFLERDNLPTLNQEEIINNRPLPVKKKKKIESVITTLPRRKSQDQMASQVNSTKNLQKS